MKIAHLIGVSALTITLSLSAARGATVESMESAATKPGFQKVDAFLHERAVADQLQKLGVTPQRVQARLASLSDSELTQVAAQVDRLQAGGEIQSGNPHPLGAIGCVFKCIGDTIAHIFKILFCWKDID